MKSYASRLRAATLVIAALLAPRVNAQQAVPAPIAGMARAIAAELMMHCPVADANDAGAFESCRAALQDPGMLRSALPELVLWGREGAAVQPGLAGAAFTELAPEVWTRLYAPLFMFNGNHRVEWVPAENQFLIRLETAFRNRLAPGQFPYPLWHDGQSWSAYQNANALLLWVQPQTGRIHVAQFTDHASTPPLQPVEPVARNFDGEWLWTDAAGRTQPAVTLFEGQYRPENPYRSAIDRQYRDLALQMREAQCSSCHVPSNPPQSRRLVVLSSPAHAAGEIDRVIRLVRDPSASPLPGHALSPEDGQWLLQSAQAFRTTLRAARDWETQARSGERSFARRPTDGAVSLRPATTLQLRP